MVKVRTNFQGFTSLRRNLFQSRTLSNGFLAGITRPRALGAVCGALIPAKRLSAVDAVQHLYFVLFTQGRSLY